jgi:hypothetical protein
VQEIRQKLEAKSEVIKTRQALLSGPLHPLFAMFFILQGVSQGVMITVE